MRNTWYIYIIRCNNDSLYTGVTKDVQRRFLEHSSQGIKCARYLRGKSPLHLVFSEKTANKKAAYKIEALVKKLTKQQKEALINGYSIKNFTLQKKRRTEKL
jgi:putative endonuclease